MISFAGAVGRAGIGIANGMAAAFSEVEDAKGEARNVCRSFDASGHDRDEGLLFTAQAWRPARSYAEQPQSGTAKRA